MNRGINCEAPDENDERKTLFLAVPWAVAFKNQPSEGYAVSLSSNVVVKVQLDAHGTPTINAPKADGDPARSCASSSARARAASPSTLPTRAPTSPTKTRATCR